MTDLKEAYRQRYESALVPIATNLAELVAGHLDGLVHIDRITARAKDPDHFIEKARKLDDGGMPKYKAPLTEIQDQVGARVIVFYLTDVDVVSKALDRYFRAIEEKILVPESHWAFGYFGYHRVCALPADVVPAAANNDHVPRFFELQIKTLFQHAWSEANHDLAYKPTRPLSGDEERLFAFAAAQAWGADKSFEDLRQALAPVG